MYSYNPPYVSSYYFYFILRTLKCRGGMYLFKVSDRIWI